MNWQELYAIARLLRQRADWLFDRNEEQLASESIWGALHYTGRALAERFGRSAGGSFNDGYIPGRSNSPGEVSQRKRRWRAARRLHRHFYNSNLDARRLASDRALATELLDEASGVLQSNLT